MARIGSDRRSIHVYAAYGITFAVPFPCRDLKPAAPGTRADLTVRIGHVPRTLDAPLMRDERIDAKPGRFLLRGGRRAGRFLVQDGAVTLERNPAAEEDALARCFTEEVLPAVLRQRGVLVLHANAALTPRGVIAIAGQSGAGKSTSLATLLELGCAMLSDDITALVSSGGGHVQVLPGVGRVNLTEAAVRRLGYESHPGLDHSWRPTKAALSAGGSLADRPGRLAAIYVLFTHDSPDVCLQPVTGLEKFNLVQQCIYGPMLPGEHPGVFPLVQTVMQTAQVYRLQRPAGRWTVAEVADAILSAGRPAELGGVR